MTTVGRPDRVVVVGAGHAGFTVASELRMAGFEGSVTLVDGQDHLPYQRPPLSKAYLTGDLDDAGLLFRRPEYYENEQISLVRSEVAISIDRPAREVALASGRRLPYDALVLATGARPRSASFVPDGVAGVHQLRAWEDASRIGDALRTSRRAVIVGGGFIGLEIASAASKAGLEVDVIEGQDRLMSRALGSVMSGYALRVLEDAGIRVRLGQVVERLEVADGRATGVLLGSGETVPAELLVVGLGVVPETTLAEAAGLVVENGVAVNEHLETSDPAISAIGDCCSFPSPLTGGRVRLESVQNATDQARTVVSRLLGAPQPYAATPWFWSDQVGMKLQMVGVAVPGDREEVRGDMSTGRFSVLRFVGDTLMSAESVNAAGDHVSLRTLVAHRHDPDVVGALARGGSGTDLKHLARAVRARASAVDATA